MSHDWEQCNDLAACLVRAAQDDDHAYGVSPAEYEMRNAILPLAQRYYDVGVPADVISRVLRHVADQVDEVFREGSRYAGLCYNQAVAERDGRRRARSGEVRPRLLVDNRENEPPA